MTSDEKILGVLEKQGKVLEHHSKVFEKLLSDIQDLKKGQDRSEKRLDTVEEVLNDLQQVFSGLKEGQKYSEQVQASLLEGQKRLEQILGQHSTMLEALGTGQQDNSQEQGEQFEFIKHLAEQIKRLRAVVATKPELDLTMELVIKEINARIDLAVISLAKKVQSHERRLNNADIPNPDKH